MYFDLLSCVSFGTWVKWCHLKIIVLFTQITQYFLKWMEFSTLSIYIVLIYLISKQKQSLLFAKLDDCFNVLIAENLPYTAKQEKKYFKEETREC